MACTTREQWLIDLAKQLEPLFIEQGATLPKYRIACGFPSKGGLSAKNRTIGECWNPNASADNTTEIIMSITKDEPMKVAGVVAHEMIHAAIGTEAGHGPKFRRLALAIGLEGKMTATTESDAFKRRVQPILDKIGDYPHAKLDASMRKKQTTRMVKCVCDESGYTIRTARKWIDLHGAPISPMNGLTMRVC